MFTVEYAVDADATLAANRAYAQRLWGDGLPLVPATRERVDWILRGSVLPRTHALGKFPPRGGVVTIEGAADRARDGGRTARVPAGADRSSRGLPRSAVRLRCAAGGFRKRLPGHHRQRPDQQAESG